MKKTTIYIEKRYRGADYSKAVLGGVLDELKIK